MSGTGGAVAPYSVDEDGPENGRGWPKIPQPSLGPATPRYIEDIDTRRGRSSSARVEVLRLLLITRAPRIG